MDKKEYNYVVTGLDVFNKFFRDYHLQGCILEKVHGSDVCTSVIHRKGQYVEAFLS